MQPNGAMHQPNTDSAICNPWDTTVPENVGGKLVVAQVFTSDSSHGLSATYCSCRNDGSHIGLDDIIVLKDHHHS